MVVLVWVLEEQFDAIDLGKYLGQKAGSAWKKVVEPAACRSEACGWGPQSQSPVSWKQAYLLFLPHPLTGSSPWKWGLSTPWPWISRALQATVGQVET